MLNKDADLNTIVYANVNSKLTLKSKHKLDELAAQVAFWNSEDNPMTSNSPNLYTSEPSLSKESNSRHPKTNTNVSPLISNNTIINQRTPISSKGMVKNLADFFNNLSTPSNEPQTSKILKPAKSLEFPLNLTKYSKLERIKDQENIDPYQDSDFPEPPPMLINDTIDDDYQNISLRKENDYDEDELQPTNHNKLSNRPESSIYSSPDITRVSSFTSNSSIFSEIKNIWQFVITEPETESLNNKAVVKKPKELRRSRSFNDLNYVEPSTTDESELDQKFNVISSDDSFIYPSQSFEIITPITEVAYDPLDLAKEMVGLKKHTIANLESLKKKLNDHQFQIGSEKHTDICREIVKNILMTKSLTEKINMGGQRPGAIFGSLKMEKIRFSLKPGFVLIDYKKLAEQGSLGKLCDLGRIFHSILYVRCFRDPSISESGIFTLVDRIEAERLEIPYQDVEWLEMFVSIHFEKLLPEFRLIFDLYCMYVSQNKKRSKIKATPRKKTPSKTFCNTPIETDRSAFFANMCSFEVTTKTVVGNHETITRKMMVPTLYPFSGKVKYMGNLKLNLAKPICKGKLSIYRDVAGVGSWDNYDCVVTQTGIIGGKRSEISNEIEDVDIEVPFYMCLEAAKPCVFSICAKANSFSMLLHENAHVDTKHTNRRLSTDGKIKNRFLASAESDEDVERWCKAISETRESFIEWAYDSDQS